MSQELKRKRIQEELEQKTADGKFADVSISSISDGLFSKHKVFLSKQDIGKLESFLDSLGLSFEPNPRLTDWNLRPETTVVVYQKISVPNLELTQRYRMAAMFVTIAVAVALADEHFVNAEQNLLERHVEKNLNLPLGERRSLRAFLRWLSIVKKPYLSDVLPKVRSFDRGTRRVLADFCIEVALADEVVDPREVAVLERIFRTLNIPVLGLRSRLGKQKPLPQSLPETKKAKLLDDKTADALLSASRVKMIEAFFSKASA